MTDMTILHNENMQERRSGRFRRWLGERHLLTKWGAGCFLVILLLLILTPLISPYDPAAQNLLQKLKWPSAQHWLGTDQFGRDVLSRVIHGGLFSVSVATITIVLCAVIGIVLGALSARKGGLVDELVMRLVDLLIAFPDVVVAMFFIATMGPGPVTLIVALTAVGWTPFARMMRGLTLEVSSREYIEAAEALACSRWFIIYRHIIPNTMGPIFAMAFLRFGHKLITVGGLSFLGLGIQPPASDWGTMLADARNYMDRMPWLVIAPGLAIFITALSVTMIGKGLEFERNRERRDSEAK